MLSELVVSGRFIQFASFRNFISLLCPCSTLEIILEALVDNDLTAHNMATKMKSVLGKRSRMSKGFQDAAPIASGSEPEDDSDDSNPISGESDSDTSSDEDDSESDDEEEELPENLPGYDQVLQQPFYEVGDKGDQLQCVLCGPKIFQSKDKFKQEHMSSKVCILVAFPCIGLQQSDDHADPGLFFTRSCTSAASNASRTAWPTRPLTIFQMIHELSLLSVTKLPALKIRPRPMRRQKPQPSTSRQPKSASLKSGR